MMNAILLTSNSRQSGIFRPVPLGPLQIRNSNSETQSTLENTPLPSFGVQNLSLFQISNFEYGTSQHV